MVAGVVTGGAVANVLAAFVPGDGQSKTGGQLGLANAVNTATFAVRNGLEEQDAAELALKVDMSSIKVAGNVLEVLSVLVEGQVDRRDAVDDAAVGVQEKRALDSQGLLWEDLAMGRDEQVAGRTALDFVIGVETGDFLGFRVLCHNFLS